MSHALRKLFIATTSSLMMLAGVVSGEYSDSPAFWQNQCPPCTPICCENSCNSCSSFLVEVDFLYWRALQNGIACGCSSAFKNHKWDYGYRLGGEYDFECSCWDVAIYWTHFNCKDHKKGRRDHNDSSSSSSSSPIAGISSSSRSSSSGSHCANDFSHGHWKLNYDVIDVTLGRDFNMYSCTNVRPFIGVRGVWIEEHIRSHNESVQVTSFGDNTIIFDNHSKEDFSGAGPEFGVEADWNLGSGFGIYGVLSGGFLYGEFKIRTNETQTFLNPTQILYCNEHHRPDAVESFFDAVIGVQYEYCFCNKSRLQLRAGWEHHQYFDHNHIGTNGDLTLDGLTLSAGYSF